MQQFFGLVRDSAMYLLYFVRGTYRSLRENTGLAAVSVVLAFGIWIVVIEADNPTRTRVIPEDIPVEPINVPANAAVVEPVPSVRVRVAVNDDTFAALKPADFIATVDLEGLTVGTYESLPVQVRPRAGVGNVRVEAVLPETIAVTLAELRAKEVPVIPEITGALIPGYTMSSPELEESSVIVSGPQSEVDKVTQATAAIDINGRSSDIDTAVRLAARDARGTLIPGVQIDPPLLNVRIDVEQQRFSRSMAISASIVDSPADGYNVVSVSVSPPAVTVTGSESFITGTASIPTREVSIAGATESIVRTVSLNLPSGAEVTGSAPVVTVTVRIAPATGAYNLTIPVSVENLGDSVAIQGALPSVAVTVAGPLPRLQSLGAGDISAVINLNGLGPGTHTVAVEGRAADGLGVTAVNPGAINVTLVGR